MISELLVLALLLKLASEGFKILRRAFFHPLKHVPGPWYAALSDLWLSFHFFSFKQTYVLHDLFATYGPVVRVGPDKVVFCDLDTMRDVYLVQKFEKSPLYKNFKINGLDQSLTILDNPSHTARRKASGPHYAASSITHLQPEMHKVVLETVDRLDSVAGAMSVDCLEIAKHLVADIVVFSTFGYNLGAVERWSPTVTDEFCTAISDFPKLGIVSSLFPHWAWSILCQIPHDRWRRFTQCSQFLKQFVVARMQDAQQQIEQEKEFDRPPLIYRLLTHPLERDAVITEGLAHLIAGTETTSTTFSYFLWQLSCSPDVLGKLRSELDAAMPDRRVIPDLSVLQNLPYLNAFVMEGLRVHGAVSPLLERAVPAGADYNLLGYSLPAGTLVGTQGWSMHRDPNVFPDPDTFNPDRWLDDSDKDAAAKRAAHLMPFGLGTRMCAGHQLAQSVLRIALAGIVRNFDVKSDPSTTKESMKMRHGFASFPTSGECRLIFTPRPE